MIKEKTMRIQERIKNCGLVFALLFVCLSATVEAKTYFVHADHLGTPQVITDDQQNVAWKANYDPFGKATVTTETITNNLRFPGQYYDQETGIHYNYFRDYDPSTGRYIESDPIGLSGGTNTYVYSLNNTLRFVDPLGLVVCTCKANGPGSRNTSAHKGSGNAPKTCDYSCDCDCDGIQKPTQVKDAITPFATDDLATCIEQNPGDNGFNFFTVDTDSLIDELKFGSFSDGDILDKLDKEACKDCDE